MVIWPENVTHSTYHLSVWLYMIIINFQGSIVDNTVYRQNVVLKASIIQQVQVIFIGKGLWAKEDILGS